MEVNDYVRNKYGIAKIIDIKNTNGIDVLVFDKDICFLVNKETGEIKDDKLFNQLAIIEGVDINKIKSSPNIIDLIQSGDYVNGKSICKNACGDLIFTDTGVDLEEKNIKSIVTKEQFKSMEYRIGD